MTEATKNFLIRVAGIVVGLLVIIIVGRFVGAVSRGTAHVPPEVQSQIWTGITGLVVVVSTATVTYINSRSNERTAQQIQLNSDRNAHETQQKITEVAHTTDEVKHVVTNGLSKDTAAMVRADAEKAQRAAQDAIRGSRRQQDVEQNAKAIAELTGKLDALLLSLTPPSVAPAETPEDKTT